MSHQIVICGACADPLRAALSTGVAAATVVA
jgi:hypothetical protein